jgi:hypothetical protein
MKLFRATKNLIDDGWGFFLFATATGVVMCAYAMLTVAGIIR